ncbi:glycosyltransferase [Desulfocurvus sp. DL9XJH121]
MPTHPFRQYTDQILAFDLGGSPSEPVPDMPPERAQQALLSIVKAWRKEPRPVVLLMGLGDGETVRLLDQALPKDVTLVVAERDVAHARRLAADPEAPWSRPDGRTHLLADTSPWAHFMLWTLNGLTPGTALLRATPGGAHRGWTDPRRMFTAARPLAAPATDATPTMCLAAILAPGDPGLEEFFAQAPAFLKEVLVVWDAEEPPAREFACAAPVRHLARPLGDDFSAQRNLLLSQCRSQWLLSLDADERLSPAAWEVCRRLAVRLAGMGAGGCMLPRRTLSRDGRGFLAGYGLWPDLQLRLVKWTPRLKYERPVHERLTGVRGPFAISLNASIEHLSHVLKTPEELRSKLAGFDEAGNGALSHTLSGEYPTLPLDFLPEVQSPEEFAGVLLPFDPA